MSDLEDLISPDSDEESGEFTIQSLWSSISKNGDIIVVIDRVDEARVRKQLSSIKAKENSKIKNAGLRPDETTLEFVEHADASLEKNQVKLQIFLKQKPTVKIHKLIVAKD